MNSPMCVLINSDIKIGKGKLAGQVSHSVGTFCYRGTYSQDDMDFFINNNNIELIYCNQSILEKLENTDKYITIRDKGLTQLEPNTLTTINLGFIPKHDAIKLITEMECLK